MDEQTYTIGELAEAAGVTPRTIRYYTAEGLLPPPDARGKYALYGPEHLLRLRLIARLKEAYLPLGEIRARLAGLTPGELAALAEAPEPSSSAADYVAQVIAARGQPRALAERAPGYAATPAPRAEAGGRIAERRVAPMLGYAAPARGGAHHAAPATEQVADERWQRIPLAPGIELHVREPAPPEVRRALAQLVAQARALLRDEGDAALGDHASGGHDR